MIKKLADDEIDLIKIFFILWQKKWIIVTTTILAIVTMYLIISIKNKEKKNIYSATSEIRPISVYDEAKYNIYNSFVKSLKPYSLEQYDIDQSIIDNKNSVLNNEYLIIEKNDLVLNSSSSNLEINNVNKKFLFDLFIDELNEKNNLVNYVKRSNIFEKKNFINDSEYEGAIFDFIDSIKLLNIDEENLEKFGKPIILKFEIEDKNKAVAFLKFLEKDVNLAIQNNINLMFSNFINYVETIINFQIEDIETQIIIVDEVKKKFLEKKKSLLKADRYIERMKKIYDGSPFSNSKNFYAAKIVSDSVSFNQSNKPVSQIKLIILSGIIGMFVGIFLSFFLAAIQNRK